jgi:hypothetical protein
MGIRWNDLRPNADFTLNGGGNNVIDFMVPASRRQPRMNGHFNFHYDEALRIMGPVPRFHREFLVGSDRPARARLRCHRLRQPVRDRLAGLVDSSTGSL